MLHQKMCKWYNDFAFSAQKNTINHCLFHLCLLSLIYSLHSLTSIFFIQTNGFLWIFSLSPILWGKCVTNIQKRLYSMHKSKRANFSSVKNECSYSVITCRKKITLGKHEISKTCFKKKKNERKITKISTYFWTCI